MVCEKKKEIGLLMELRKDGRQTLTDISKKIGMPVSTIFDKVKANRNQMINRFTCLLDFRKIGFNCRAQIVLRIRKDQKDQKAEMQEYLVRHPNVNSVYKINNGYDFLVETVFRELKELDEFLEKLEEQFRVQEKNVYYIIDDVAREVFMTDQLHAEIIGMI